MTNPTTDQMSERVFKWLWPDECWHEKGVFKNLGYRESGFRVTKEPYCPLCKKTYSWHYNHPDFSTAEGFQQLKDKMMEDADRWIAFSEHTTGTLWPTSTKHGAVYIGFTRAFILAKNPLTFLTAVYDFIKGTEADKINSHETLKRWVESFDPETAWTVGLDEHPDGYEDACHCNMCLSYD